MLRWGVSNLDVDDMAELVTAGGKACATDQILYDLTRRGPEHDLLPWLAERAVPVMAYSPVEQGRLVSHPALTGIARALDATPAQVALGLAARAGKHHRHPEGGQRRAVRENRAAADLVLAPATMTRLDAIFPPPTGPVPLEML